MAPRSDSPRFDGSEKRQPTSTVHTGTEPWAVQTRSANQHNGRQGLEARVGNGRRMDPRRCCRVLGHMCAAGRQALPAGPIRQWFWTGMRRVPGWPLQAFRWCRHVQAAVRSLECIGWAIFACSSPGAFREWLNNRNEYHAWRKAVRAVRAERNSGSCAKMRKAARYLLLIIHPDKFEMIRPACPRDMSTSLAAEFSSEYDKHKTLCAGQ